MIKDRAIKASISAILFGIFILVFGLIIVALSYLLHVGLIYYIGATIFVVGIGLLLMAVVALFSVAIVCLIEKNSYDAYNDKNNNL